MLNGNILLNIFNVENIFTRFNVFKSVFYRGGKFIGIRRLAIGSCFCGNCGGFGLFCSSFANSSAATRQKVILLFFGGLLFFLFSEFFLGSRSAENWACNIHAAEFFLGRNNSLLRNRLVILFLGFKGCPRGNIAIIKPNS